MIKSKRKLRICLVASAGGHMSQLLKLENSWAGYETVYITTGEAVRKKLRPKSKVYVVRECNHRHPIRVIFVLLRCIGVLARERPDVLISTGAAAGCIACFLSKLLGAKIVWVDSIANVGRISLSGRMVRYIADLFLVQWPDLAKEYRNVEYLGTVV